MQDRINKAYRVSLSYGENCNLTALLMFTVKILKMGPFFLGLP
jgi:hypothetical protein